MAILKQLQTHQRSVLRTTHLIGRDPGHSHICLPNNDISRQHAQLLWQAPHWLIRDTSKNGVWLNGQRIKAQQTPTLCVGDQLRFGLQHDNTWELVDSAAPASCLIPTEQAHEPIWLYQDTHTNRQAPHLDYEPIDAQHCFLKLGREYGEYHQGQWIDYQGHNWQLLLVPPNPVKTTQLSQSVNINTIRWQFNCSLDEEHIRLKGVTDNGQTLDLGERVHHYLLLILARQRQHDAEQGFDKSSQGWIEMTSLCTMLGLEQTHINIHIFRARKQLQSLIPQPLDTVDFIERRSGSIRFRYAHYTIYRGSQVEAGMPNNHQLLDTTSASYSL